MSEFFLISKTGVGRLILWEQNKHKARCRLCEKEIPGGEGYRFKRMFLSQFKSGYVCRLCVGRYLEADERWHWNSWIGALFPEIDQTINPLSGKDLAKVWMEKGLNGLSEFLYPKEEKI